MSCTIKIVLTYTICIAHFQTADTFRFLSSTGSLIEPPVSENINSSVGRLKHVGALDNDENLTPLGHHLATLPVDVRIGKLMLYGAIFSCLDAALTMAACLSHKSPFVSPFGKKDEADRKKVKFSLGYSDHITFLVAYKKWLATYKKSPFAGRNFANENFMSLKTLQTIADIKHQFLEYLVDIGFVAVNLEKKHRLGQDNVLTITGSEFNRNGENISLLSSVLCAALYPNVIKVLTPEKSFIMSASGAVPKENDAKDLRYVTAKDMVFMHPSSVNYKITNFPSPFLVYQEKVRTSKIYFRDCTMVPVIPLILFSGFDLDIIVQNGETFIKLEDGWILFQVEEHKIAEMMKMIRYELFMLLEEKIQDPLLNLLHHDKGERIISTILYLISL